MGYLRGAVLIEWLRTPLALQWQGIRTVLGIDDDVAAALSSLPILTELSTANCRSVAFLPALTRLRTLSLYIDPAVRLAEGLVVELSRCSQLTDLTLYAADVTSQHLRQVLPHLPHLRELELVPCVVLAVVPV